MPWLFDTRSGNTLIEFMQQFGFVANTNRFVSNEDWVTRKPKYLFFGSPLYIDERELHETFSYMLSVGLYFKENTEKVRALNLRLAAEQGYLEGCDISCLRSRYLEESCQPRCSEQGRTIPTRGEQAGCRTAAGGRGDPRAGASPPKGDGLAPNRG